MLRRVLGLALTLGVLLPNAASARPEEPHDLQIAPWQLLNNQLLPVLAAQPEPAMPTMKIALPMPSSLARMPLNVRKQVVGCLLFGVHPLMWLTPTDAVLDQPCDHPVTKPVERIGLDFTAQGFEANLRKLEVADERMIQAERCLVAGQLAHAIECYTRAAEACPGSPLAHQAQAAVNRVFARMYLCPPVGAEEAEPKPVVVVARKVRPTNKEARQAKKKPVVVNGQVQPPVPAPGLEKLEVPMPALRLKIEEQSTLPDGAGSEESDGEPWWFLPWFEEWTRAGKSA